VISPFGRPSLLVASTKRPIARALTQFIRLFLGEYLPHHFPDEYARPLNCVEDLHTLLDNRGRHELFDTVCVVDLTDGGARWDITLSETGMRPSELVLGYPGVYWIFLVRELPHGINEIPKARAIHFLPLDNLTHLLQLLQRHAAGFRAWFDPTGLRRLIRGGLERSDETPPAYGASIDDEANFAVLNGYVLYRSNRSTYVISSHSELENVLDSATEFGDGGS
jgi:hypothetical protein